MLKIREKFEPRISPIASSNFDRELLAATFDNLEVYGPLCFNNFSYALREFLRRLLHFRAPKPEIESCKWFKPDKSSDNGITRAHRIKYAIQGGLSDEFVVKKLGIDTSKIYAELSTAQDILNKYTHIEEGTFSISKNDTYRLAEECLQALETYITKIDECKDRVRHNLLDEIDKHLINKVVSDGVDEIGEIATHGWVDEILIEEVVVDKILAKTVRLTVFGNIGVGLQYGSKSDVRNDIGYSTSDSFPYSASITVLMKRPLGMHAKVDSLNVNTDSFYE